jgi:hypothetical protein
MANEVTYSTDGNTQFQLQIGAVTFTGTGGYLFTGGGPYPDFDNQILGGYPAASYEFTYMSGGLPVTVVVAANELGMPLQNVVIGGVSYDWFFILLDQLPGFPTFEIHRAGVQGEIVFDSGQLYFCQAGIAPNQETIWQVIAPD